jgi:hypothetical protein
VSGHIYVVSASTFAMLNFPENGVIGTLPEASRW